MSFITMDFLFKKPLDTSEQIITASKYQIHGEELSINTHTHTHIHKKELLMQ